MNELGDPLDTREAGLELLEVRSLCAHKTRDQVNVTSEYMRAVLCSMPPRDKTYERLSPALSGPIVSERPVHNNAVAKERSWKDKVTARFWGTRIDDVQQKRDQDGTQTSDWQGNKVLDLLNCCPQHCRMTARAAAPCRTHEWLVGPENGSKVYVRAATSEYRTWNQVRPAMMLKAPRIWASV